MRYISRIVYKDRDLVIFGFNFSDLNAKGLSDKPLGEDWFGYGTVITIKDTVSGDEKIYNLCDCGCRKLKHLIKRWLNDGVVGVTEYSLSQYGNIEIDFAVYGKRNFLFDGCLKYIGDLKEAPLELFHVPSHSGLCWQTPTHKAGQGINTVFMSESHTLFSKHEQSDVHFVGDLIIQYIKDFTMRGKDMVNYNLNAIAHICDFDDSLLTISDDKIDAGGYIDYPMPVYSVYRLQLNAMFQVFGCPLYISSDGDLYLGYTTIYAGSSGLEGAIQYKITDMEKFKMIVTKCIAVGDKSGFLNMRPTTDIETKWRIV